MTLTLQKWPFVWPVRWVSQEAARRAGVKLLEPIMEVEVTTPEDYMGEVIGDLSSRRGKIEEMGPPW